LATITKNPKEGEGGELQVLLVVTIEEKNCSFFVAKTTRFFFSFFATKKHTK
jgi:hypothetical protein